MEGTSDVEGEATHAGAGFEDFEGRGFIVLVVFAGTRRVEVEKRDDCVGVVGIDLELFSFSNLPAYWGFVIVFTGVARRSLLMM